MSRTRRAQSVPIIVDDKRKSLVAREMRIRGTVAQDDGLPYPGMRSSQTCTPKGWITSGEYAFWTQWQRLRIHHFTREFMEGAKCDWLLASGSSASRESLLHCAEINRSTPAHRAVLEAEVELVYVERVRRSEVGMQSDA